jgi:hypothetical protein
MGQGEWLYASLIINWESKKEKRFPFCSKNTLEVKGKGSFFSTAAF